MRVLNVVVSKPLGGGVEAYFRKLSPHFDFKIDNLLVGRNRSDTGMIAEVGRLGSKLVEFVWRLLRERHEVILFNPSLEARAMGRDLLFLLLAKCARRRCIVFIHGWQPAFEEQIERRRHLRPVRRLLNLADAIIVLAEQFRCSLRRWGVRVPIYLESMTAEVPDEPEALLAMRSRRLGEPLRLLFVARLISSKGLREAIETVSILRERGKAVELLVAGDGPELEPARRQAREAGLAEVRFFGYVGGADLAEAYAGADIFFLPTRHGEGMPNAVLEAMAFGLPVVTRAVGGVPDFFETPQMGAITTSTEPAEFASLIALFADPGRRLDVGRHNVAFAARFFTTRAAAERLSSLIRRIGSDERSYAGWSWREFDEDPVSDGGGGEQLR